MPCHDVTIVGGALHAGESTIGDDAAIKEGVQILHIVSGYSMRLLDGTADEASIGSFMEAVASYPLGRDRAVERALEQAEKMQVSPGNIQAAVAN